MMFKRRMLLGLLGLMVMTGGVEAAPKWWKSLQKQNQARIDINAQAGKTYSLTVYDAPAVGVAFYSKLYNEATHQPVKWTASGGGLRLPTGAVAGDWVQVDGLVADSKTSYILTIGRYSEIAFKLTKAPGGGTGGIIGSPVSPACSLVIYDGPLRVQHGLLGLCPNLTITPIDKPDWINWIK